MSGQDDAAAFDWRDIAFVVFDVDGTLYDQARLRRRMAAELLLHCARTLSLDAIEVLRHYRRFRERLAEQEREDFEPKLVEMTAERARRTPAQVQALVAEWIERRPLRRLAACRYEGLPALFAAIKAGGKTIGVLSDYSAEDKLKALGLEADLVAAAGDPQVCVMKPHPRGLQVLMERAKAAPATTVMIGDRAERDGAAARRAGAQVLIRSTSRLEGFPTFARYDGPPFAPLLGANRGG